MNRFTLAIWAVLCPGAAAAHPEHFSGEGYGLAHYLTDPYHVAIAGTVVLFAIAGARFIRRRRQRFPNVRS